MELAKLRFSVGQMVYGKLKGYPPWPALITKIEKNIATIVYFNANQQYSNISFSKLTPYHAGHKIVDKYYGRDKKFSKAFDEMQLVLDVQLKKKQEEKNTKKKEKMAKEKEMKEREAMVKEKKLMEKEKMKREMVIKQSKNAAIILHRLSPLDVKRIKKKLKQDKLKQNQFKSERKLRSGRRT